MKNIVLLIALLNVYLVNAKVWQVGSTRTYKVPGAVVNLVNDGDTIYIDGGVYSNDAVQWAKKNLKFIGLGTSANPTILQYTGDIPNEKGIWVFAQPGVSDNPYLENITFSGAQVSDAAGGNGAGIRCQVVNLTVNRCKFEYCQDGILEGGAYTGSNVIIENSEFAHNGYNGTDNSLVGYEHQMYISAEADTLIVENCWIHDVRGQGHSLKTRAQRSYILYNMIDEANGNGSFEIDIAQGGLVVAIGNVIIQGTSDANHTIICLEAITNPIEELYFVNNTIINKYTGNVRFVQVNVASGVNVFKFYNNIFASVPTASNTYFANNIPAVIDTANNIRVRNYTTIGFVNSAMDNYNLLSTATSAIDKGTACGTTNEGYSLTPNYMSQNDSTSLLPRTIYGSAIDIGAYEYEGNVGINTLSTNNCQLSTKVYPNPFNNYTLIKLNSNSNYGQVIIKIYDNSNRCVKIIECIPQNDIIRIQKDDLSSGNYLYSIINKENELIGTGKFTIE